MAKYPSTYQGLRALSRAQENNKSEPTYQQLCSGCSGGLSAAPSVLEDVWATCLWQHPDINIVLANSNFSTFQSFQSSLTIRKNPDFSCPYVRFFIGKIYCFFDSKQFYIKNFAF